MIYQLKTNVKQAFTCSFLNVKLFYGRLLLEKIPRKCYYFPVIFMFGVIFVSNQKGWGCATFIVFIMVIGLIRGCLGYDKDKQEISVNDSTEVVETVASPNPEEKPSNIPKVEFTGRFDPTILYVGEKLVIEFKVKNISEQPIKGFKIAGHGPFKKCTIANVMPAASYESGWGTYWFNSTLEIPPGETRALYITAYPNESGNFEFDFTPYSINGIMFEDSTGNIINIGGKVAVIR
jgi:general stress protein CsbA